MKRRRLTAQELVRELEQDPAWAARRGEQKREFAALEVALREDERELVAELGVLGYHVASVWDLVNNAPHPVLERRFIGSYTTAYPVLVRHLILPHHRRIKEGIVRSLTVRDGGILVEKALLAAFQLEQNPQLRWVLANALRVAMPYHRRRKYPEIAAAYRSSQSADA
jgi:hypothetical protein